MPSTSIPISLIKLQLPRRLLQFNDGNLSRAEPHALSHFDVVGVHRLAVRETGPVVCAIEILGDIDLHLFNEGRHFKLAEALGANVMTIDGVRGTRFAVWAPNAGRVAVVGDFNTWDTRRHPMRLRHGAGIWEPFLPRVAEGTRYKFDIIGAGGVRTPQKADPLAQQTELPPATASNCTTFHSSAIRRPMALPWWSQAQAS